MIEPKRNFTQVKVKEFTGYPTVRIEPMIRITPEVLNAADVGPSFGPAVCFSNHDVVPANRYQGIGLPVIHIVQNITLNSKKPNEPIKFMISL